MTFARGLLSAGPVKSGPAKIWPINQHWAFASNKSTPFPHCIKLGHALFVGNGRPSRMVARSGSKSQAIYSNSRKRQLKQLQEGELEHSCPKRREIRHPTFSPPELYENISTKYVEKNALRALSAKIPEINAVVTEPVKSPPLRPCLPYFGRTRRSASQLSDVAQHVECEGPPDLSDLRGVRRCGSLLVLQS